MGNLINPGSAGFAKEIKEGNYVDKTGLIRLTNSVVHNPHGMYLCVSRPRRFGKTTAANMLCAYYQRGCDSRGLFQGLEASRDTSFEEHLGGYDVVRLDMARLGSEAAAIEDLIANVRNGCVADIVRAFRDHPDFEYAIRPWLDSPLWMLLNSVWQLTGISCVFVIDEWDWPFRRFPNEPEGLHRYLEFLSGLLKGADYLALAFMTGILPVKTYGDESVLNMFRSVGIANTREFAPYTGFTETEVMHLCKRHGMDFDQIRAWYDGYRVPERTRPGELPSMLSIYNPNSVTQAMTLGEYGSYWTNTQLFERLQSYINLNLAGLKDLVAELMAGGQVEVNMRSFPYRIVDLPSAEAVLTLLVHLGYLTFEPAGDAETPTRGWVSIPNHEVLLEYRDAVHDGPYIQPLLEALESSEVLIASMLAGDENAVARAIERSHEEHASVIAANNEDSLAAVLTVSLYTAVTRYDIYRELPSGKGFCDLALVPRRGVDSPAMVVELKWNHDASTAIRQIKRKRYAGKLARGFGEVLLVGISYDKRHREHPYTCEIERWDMMV